MPAQERCTVRAVAVREGAVWFVLAIDDDIAAHTSDIARIPAALKKAVEQNRRLAALSTGRLSRRPAPRQYADMFDRARVELRSLDHPEFTIRLPD